MIVLVGKTCAGKDTVKKEMIRVGIKPIVTYTTRPRREGEVRGDTYHFISKFKFRILKFFGFFAETTSYNVANGSTWHYGTSKKSIRQADKNTVIILNPEGLKKIYNKYDDIFSVYLELPQEEIEKRLINRGDNCEEAERRINADNEDFKYIENYVSYTLRCFNLPAYIIADTIIHLNNNN